MNWRNLLSPVAATLVIGLSSTVAQAQPPPGGPGFGGKQLFGRFGRSAGMSDPTLSNMMSLLTRPDVQNALQITFKQKNDLDDIQNSSMTDMFNRAREEFKDIRNMTPDERAAQKDALQARGREMIQTFVGELDKKTEAVLRPDQLKRLKEIDLQWRGPMAMGDPKVSLSVGLTAEESTKVTAVITDFRTQQGNAMRTAFQGFGPGGSGFRARQGGTGQNPNDPNPQIRQAPTPPDPAEMQEKMAAADREVTKIKKASGAKVLALLTDDEKQKWQTLQGKPFVFQTILDTANN